MLNATDAISNVSIMSGDPVASGLARSIAEPGGNVTGVSYYATELTGERLELLKAAVPELTTAVALTLVSSGRLAGGTFELYLRHREIVDGMWRLQREMAEGAAIKIQQFAVAIERTMWASTQTPEIVARGLN